MVCKPSLREAASQCVNDGTRRLIFGRGAGLKIQKQEDHEPSFFQLREGNMSACLASSFSKHNAVNETKYSGLFRETEASRISGSGLYNQVALLGSNDEQCVDAGVLDGCEGDLKPDLTVNTVSLTVLGLRLLFLKTVVFNVLLTLRLWISH